MPQDILQTLQQAPWQKLASGPYNTVYKATVPINGQPTAMIKKHPSVHNNLNHSKEDEDLALLTMLSHPKRFFRIFSELNPDVKAWPDPNNNCVYVEDLGSQQATDAQMSEQLQKIYVASGRIILDAHIKNNLLSSPTYGTRCVDTDLTIKRRGSTVTLQYLTLWSLDSIITSWRTCLFDENSRSLCSKTIATIIFLLLLDQYYFDDNDSTSPENIEFRATILAQHTNMIDSIADLQIYIIQRAPVLFYLIPQKAVGLFTLLRQSCHLSPTHRNQLLFTYFYIYYIAATRGTITDTFGFPTSCGERFCHILLVTPNQILICASLLDLDIDPMLLLTNQACFAKIRTIHWIQYYKNIHAFSHFILQLLNCDVVASTTTGQMQRLSGYDSFQDRMKVLHTINQHTNDDVLQYLLNHNFFKQATLMLLYKNPLSLNRTIYSLLITQQTPIICTLISIIKDKGNIDHNKLATSEKPFRSPEHKLQVISCFFQNQQLLTENATGKSRDCQSLCKCDVNYLIHYICLLLQPKTPPPLTIKRAFVQQPPVFSIKKKTVKPSNHFPRLQQAARKLLIR